jgi:sulfofructose kinase
MKHVICVGLAVLDHIFYLAEIPQAPVKYFATDYQTVGGGNAATAAVAVSRAGGEATFWGQLGNDRNGDFILAELEGFGVDVQDVLRFSGIQSGVSAVIIDANGERLIVNYRDPKFLGNAEWLPLDKLEKASAVLADFRWQEGALRALSKARTLGIPGILDVDLTPDCLNEELLSTASHLLFSEPALHDFAKGQPRAEALRIAEQLNHGWVGVTAGSSGIYWLEDGKLRHLPAFEIHTIQTLGAGDIFHGVFALALAEGHSERTALLRASGAAAIRCSKSGGWESIPQCSEIESFIKNNK